MNILKLIFCFTFVLVLTSNRDLFAQWEKNPIPELPNHHLKNVPVAPADINDKTDETQMGVNSNALIVGLSIPAGRLSTQLRPGFSVGYDYNFNFTKNVDIYLNLTGNLFTTKKSDSASAVERFVDLAVVLEYYAGPRFYFDAGSKTTPVKFMAEAGIGFYTPIGTKYIFDDNANFSGIESLSDALRGGVNAGFGAYITGARTIITKVKVHQLFSIPTTYFGLYAGLVL
jgi:hypothetical protein